MSAQRDRAIRLLLVLLVTGALLALATHGHERMGDDAGCVLCVFAAGLTLPVALILLTGILLIDPERLRLPAITRRSICTFASCGLRAPPVSR
jgi:disulfide bond formation protein DsbB